MFLETLSSLPSLDEIFSLFLFCFTFFFLFFYFLNLLRSFSPKPRNTEILIFLWSCWAYKRSSFSRNFFGPRSGSIITKCTLFSCTSIGYFSGWHCCPNPNSHEKFWRKRLKEWSANRTRAWDLPDAYPNTTSKRRRYQVVKVSYSPQVFEKKAIGCKYMGTLC